MARRIRLAALLALGLMVSAEAVSLAAYRSLDAGGPPVPEELRAALALGLGDVREAAIADASGERGFLVPIGDWVTGPRGGLPSLVLWVDGRGVPVQEVEVSEETASREPKVLARLIHRNRRDRVVRLYCSVEPPPCRQLLAARMTPTLRAALAAQRLRRNPGAAAGVVALLAAGAFAAWRAMRDASRARVSLAVGLVFASATLWFVAGVFRLPSAPIWLGAQVALVGLPLFATPVAEATRAASRRLAPLVESASEGLERAAHALRLPAWGGWATALAAAGLWLPVASTDRAYFSDWANHLYYVARQAESLRALHHPSYFLHSELSGVFYPYYAFYGGTLYALTAALALVLHSVPAAYAASFGAAFAMAYGGVYWLGRQMGLGRATSGLPALVYVSSAYYLTNVYGRGSWAETVATSAIPLVLAAAVALFRAELVRTRDVCLFAAAVLVFSGSHTITLVWGGLFLAALLLLCGAAGLLPRPLPWRRALLIVELFVVAAAINGWFLLPALAYGGATGIGGYAARGFGSDTQFLNTAAVVFHLGRFVPSQSGTPGLYVQASVYALLWAIAALACAALKDEPGNPRRRLAFGLAALLAVYLALIFTGRQDPTWQALPRVLKVVQFQFRLHTYVTLAMVGLVLLGIRRVAGSRTRGVWLGSLVAATFVQLWLAGGQIAGSPRYGPVADVVAAGTRGPETFVEAHDYRFRSHAESAYLGEPVLPDPPSRLRLDPASVAADTLPVSLTSADAVSTNLVYSPFVTVQGDVELAGRTGEGWAILSPATGASGVPANGTIAAARPWPVVAGVSVTLAGLLGLAAILWRIRRAPRAAARGTPAA